MALVATAVVLIPLFYLVVSVLEYGWDAWSGRVFTERVGELAMRSVLLAAVVGLAAWSSESA